MVNHEADVAELVSEPEQTIFTMKGDRNSTNHSDLSNMPVPLSYSSADSATEYASLFGEAIISKDTLFTVTNPTNASSLNTVIMMVDHTNGPKGNFQKNDTIIEYKDAAVPEKEEEKIVDSSASVEDPICLSMCSNNHHCDANEDMIDSSTSPSTNVCQKRSSLMLPPLSDGSASPRREPLKTVSSLEEHNESRSSEFLDVIGCPCFQPSHLDCYSSSSLSKHPSVLQTDGLPNANSTNSLVDVLVLPKIRSLSLFDDNEKKDDENDRIEEEDEEEQFQLDEELMTGIIEETGAHYHITKIIVEGWIHKKGTGHDWLGSRGWKARWARLAIGYIDGYDNVEVPLLGISWYPTSTNNSTVIVLDSTVVLAVDLPNKDRPHRFEIRHAKSSGLSTPLKRDHQPNHLSSFTAAELPITRTFAAASRKARDAWVYAISQALLSYEKDKAALRKLQLRNSSDGGNNSPIKQRLSSQQQPSSLNLSPNKTRGYDDNWLNDRFPLTPPQPPSSSTSQIGHRSPSSPLRTQQRTDGRSNSNPRPVHHHSSKGVGRTHTSIIGQDGICTGTTSQDIVHYHHSHSKPMTIHTRSTSA